jgi:Asp/Glu/hydantoin racemase
VQLAPPADSHFVTTLFGNASTADVEQLRREVEQLTERAVEEHPVGAIVLECANLSPFAGVVRGITKVPVFDLYTLGITAHLSTAAEVESPVPARRLGPVPAAR